MLNYFSIFLIRFYKKLINKLNHQLIIMQKFIKFFWEKCKLNIKNYELKKIQIFVNSIIELNHIFYLGRCKKYHAANKYVKKS